MIYMDEFIDTAHTRQLRTLDTWDEYLTAAERWLHANTGKLVCYHDTDGHFGIHGHRDVVESIEYRKSLKG